MDQQPTDAFVLEHPVFSCVSMSDVFLFFLFCSVLLLFCSLCTVLLFSSMFFITSFFFFTENRANDAGAEGGGGRGARGGGGGRETQVGPCLLFGKFLAGYMYQSEVHGENASIVPRPLKPQDPGLLYIGRNRLLSSLR